MNKAVGLALIVIGVIGLAWGGIVYTTRERVVDIGPIHASREKQHDIPVPPILGAVSLIGGIVLLAAARLVRSRTRLRCRKLHPWLRFFREGLSRASPSQRCCSEPRRGFHHF